MKHNIRIKGEEQELDCELGSDIKDKNGREIFEGDKLFRNDGEIFIAKIVGYVECEDEEELQGIYAEPERFRVKELVA